MDLVRGVVDLFYFTILQLSKAAGSIQHVSSEPVVREEAGECLVTQGSGKQAVTARRLFAEIAVKRYLPHISYVFVSSSHHRLAL